MLEHKYNTVRGGYTLSSHVRYLIKGMICQFCAELILIETHCLLLINTSNCLHGWFGNWHMIGVEKANTVDPARLCGNIFPRSKNITSVLWFICSVKAG